MSEHAAPGWSFLTNHAQVLVCIAHDPGIRLRDVGERVGITERAAHRIVAELAAAGYVTRQRTGRRNHWLGIHLVGRKCNRDAVGAKITYRAGDLERHQFKVGGGSYLSYHDPRIVRAYRCSSSWGGTGSDHSGPSRRGRARGDTSEPPRGVRERLPSTATRGARALLGRARAIHRRHLALTVSSSGGVQSPWRATSREAEGLSIAQIAERLGRSPATVKAQSWPKRRPDQCPWALTIVMRSARKAPSFKAIRPLRHLAS